MWMTEIIMALDTLRNMYGLTCCIEKIENGVIYMTNHTRYFIDDLLEESEEE